MFIREKRRERKKRKMEKRRWLQKLKLETITMKHPFENPL